MMMFAGAALTALDFLTGLAASTAKSAVQSQAGATASGGAAASAFSLADTASKAADGAGRSAGAGSALSPDTWQTVLALQSRQDAKSGSAGDLVSMLDGDKDADAGPRNAVLQETQRRLQQAQMLATSAPGQALTMSI